MATDRFYATRSILDPWTAFGRRGRVIAAVGHRLAVSAPISVTKCFLITVQTHPLTELIRHFTNQNRRYINWLQRRFILATFNGLSSDLARHIEDGPSGIDQTDGSRPVLFVAAAQNGGPGPQAWSTPPPDARSFADMTPKQRVSSVRAVPLAVAQSSRRPTRRRSEPWSNVTNPTGAGFVGVRSAAGR